MNETVFRIAGYNVRVAGDTLCRLLSGFEAPENVKDEQPVCSFAPLAGTAQFDIAKLNPAFDIAHIFNTENDTSAFLFSDKNYTHMSIAADKSTDEIKMELFLAGMYSRFVELDTVLVHASLVDTLGEGGVMFVGRSGIGKTTQAFLWGKNRKALIINGDKVMLTLDREKNEVIAHGNPWHGSSIFCMNSKVKLKGIVVLDQAPENTITRLDDMGVLAEYVPHIFLPMWDEERTGMAMDTIDKMLPLVPVYKLACRPDRDAVELTYRTIFHGEY